MKKKLAMIPFSWFHDSLITSETKCYWSSPWTLRNTILNKCDHMKTPMSQQHRDAIKKGSENGKFNTFPYAHKYHQNEEVIVGTYYPTPFHFLP